MPLYKSSGTIAEMSEVKQGTSTNGKPWQRMTLVLEIPISTSAIIKQVFDVFGDSVDDVLKFKRGDEVDVTWAMSAKEWNGKLYNNVSLWKISAQMRVPGQTAQAQPQPQPQEQGSDDPNNDLPF